VAEKQQQPPAGKKVDEAKPKKEADDSTLPLLVELTFTSAVILLSLVFVVVAGISLLTGATLLDFILRAGGSTLAVGVPLILIVRQISMGALTAGLGTKDKLLPMDEPEENEIRSPFKVK
jgi:hypothetical protein